MILVLLLLEPFLMMQMCWMHSNTSWLFLNLNEQEFCGNNKLLHPYEKCGIGKIVRILFKAQKNTSMHRKNISRNYFLWQSVQQNLKFCVFPLSSLSHFISFFFSDDANTGFSLPSSGTGVIVTTAWSTS